MHLVSFVFGFVLGPLSYRPGARRIWYPLSPGAYPNGARLPVEPQPLIFSLICLGGRVEEKKFLSRVTARLLFVELARFLDL